MAAHDPQDGSGPSSDPPGDQDSGEDADLFANPEPWHPVERQLVGWSLATAFALLAVLGVLVNVYLL